MVSKMAVIKNKTGLHARPASNLVAFAKKFKSDVFLINGTKKANAKSIINILTLGAKQGTELEVAAEGEDEAQAVEQMVEFIDNLEE